jgi:hypothetical protein
MVPDVWHGLLLGLVVLAIVVPVVGFTIMIRTLASIVRTERALARLAYQEGQRTRDAFREAH